ncbi:MAG: sugar phosphate isomerase/epimerase family protein, partial [Candidatus Geothermarchaeales archaeon]
DQIQGLIQEVNCGFTLDLGHANTLVEPTQFLDALSDRIVDVHLHDNHGDYDSHLAVGEGNINFRRQFEALETVGFQGSLIMEQHRLEDFEIGFGRLKHISKYVSEGQVTDPTLD